jgi:hypothetical protein
MSILRVMEKAKTDLLSEISRLTDVIEQDFPELLKYLDETRSTLPHKDNENKVDTKSLEDYKGFLQQLIAQYSKTKK